MRVFITGAGGFIGSHLARLLVREGCEVYALLRRESDPWRIRELLPSLQVVVGDLLHPEEGWAERLASIRPETCFHLAWYAEPGKFLTSPLNLQYLAASVELAPRLAEAGCRKLVVAGSFSEYDQDLGYLAEGSALRPNTLYGACKAALYQSLALWAPAAGMELLWPRIFSVYGPGEHEKRFVPAVILATLRGEATRLTPGEQLRDYLHVADAAGAVWAAAQNNLRGPVNVGSGKPVAIGELATHIGALVGRPDLIRLGDLPYRAGDPMFVCANTQLLRSAASWVPHLDLETGLRQTITWWQAQKLNTEVPFEQPG
ncbi:MAG: NAD(P)-dependent oxidoreductase [Anaerolineae bacterium]|nr:NAD(P)-dependent oxidoreductase [Anaerolineae bacterium]